MSQDGLKALLASVDARSSTSFGTDDVRRWRPGDLDALTSAGLLRVGEFATSVICPGCPEACIRPVELVGGRDEPLRAFVVCDQRDDMGRIEVPLERLKQWRVTAPKIAEWLADELGANGGVEEIVTGRLWWLGRTTFRAGRSDVFLAAGAHRVDAANILWSARRFQECSRAVVLPLWQPPAEDLPGKVAVGLTRIVCIERERLTFDREVIEVEVARCFGRSVFRGQRFPTPPGTAWEQVSIVITADGDDAVVTAGSVTEPASPARMGLALARNPAKFTKEWGVLVLLSRHGRVGPEDPEARLITPKQVQRLKEKLRTFFGINEDPFKPYRQAKGYEPRFTLSRVR